MLKFLKEYWFTILFSLVFGLYAIFLMIIAFSPRVDTLERGFIPCTKKLTKELENCGSKAVWCHITKIVQNNVCDFEVIQTGYRLWMKGEQETPWANYYFTPEEPQEPEIPSEELKEVYENNAKILKEMEDLNQKRLLLEKDLNNKEKLETNELKENIKEDSSSDIKIEDLEPETIEGTIKDENAK